MVPPSPMTTRTRLPVSEPALSSEVSRQPASDPPACQHRGVISNDSLAGDFDSFLVDLDGVVYVGPTAVSGASETLTDLTSAGHRVCFVTNNASRTPQDVADHLTDLGVPATADDVLTSAQAGAALIARQIPAGSAVLAVGGPGVSAALESLGFRPVDAVTEPMAAGGDDVAAVLQGFGTEVGWSQLARASYVVARGLPWVATNTDITIPVADGIAPGNGALVGTVTAATGRSPEVAGKPYPPLLLRAAELSEGLRPLVIGDRLDTDIQGAGNARMSSLLVMTGVTKTLDLWRAAHYQRPDYLALDLAGLLLPPLRVASSDGVFQAGAATAKVEGTRLTLEVREDPLGAVWAAAFAIWDASGEPDNAIELADALDGQISSALARDTDT